jgi:hypothetical protein
VDELGGNAPFGQVWLGMGAGTAGLLGQGRGSSEEKLGSAGSGWGSRSWGRCAWVSGVLVRVLPTPESAAVADPARPCRGGWARLGEDVDGRREGVGEGEGSRTLVRRTDLPRV